MKKKSKVVNANVMVVLDESGSMGVCRQSTINGFNEYVETLKKDSKGIRFSLNKFSSGFMGSEDVRSVYSNVRIRDVERLTAETFNPSGATPLYDAIGTSIHQMEEKFGRTKKQNVLFVIMTDGEENSSREYSKSAISRLIKDKEERGWTFVYLGANQDSWAIGRGLGISFGNAVNYDQSNMGKVMRGLGNMTANYTSALATSGSVKSATFNASRFFEDSKTTSKGK